MPIKTVLTSDDVEAIINEATCLRDKLILSFYANTGCRVSELLAIRVSDIDLVAQTVLIPHLKAGIKKHCPKCGQTAGRTTKFCSGCGQDLSRVKATGIEEKFRLVSFDKETAALILEYLDDPKAPKGEARLIKLNRQTIYYIVRKAARDAGLEGRLLLNPETGKSHHVSPHKFRDALAVEWLNFAKADINKQKALQDHLGHQNFTTTMRYFKLAPSDVQNVSDQVRQARFGKE